MVRSRTSVQQDGCYLTRRQLLLLIPVAVRRGQDLSHMTQDARPQVVRKRCVLAATHDRMLTRCCTTRRGLLGVSQPTTTMMTSPRGGWPSDREGRSARQIGRQPNWRTFVPMPPVQPSHPNPNTTRLRTTTTALPGKRSSQGEHRRVQSTARLRCISGFGATIRISVMQTSASS